MPAEPELPVDDPELQRYLIAPPVRRRLQQLFDHASKLLKQEKYDHDYAHTLLAQCAAGDPGNLVYVEALLDNLQRKYGGNKRGGMLGFGGKGGVKKACSKKDWWEALKAGPEALKSNPWDAGVLRALAEACENLFFAEVELRYLKNALDGNPKDVELCRHCARSLTRVGQFDQAIAMWHRVEELHKNDSEAQKTISELTLERNRARAGIAREEKPLTPEQRARFAALMKAKQLMGQAQAERTAAAPTPAGPAPAAEDEPPKKREIQLTPRQKLEQSIKDNPYNPDLYRELADLLLEDDRYSDAEQVLAKALTAINDDLTLREKWEDVQILRMRQQAAIAQQRAEKLDNDETRDLAARLREELNRREIELFAARAERHPQDRRLRYELAVRLRRAGNYREAVKQLQEAREDKQFRGPATLEMGECFQHLKKFSEALQCYRRGADMVPAGSEQQKTALYRAGVLGAALKEREAAEKCFRKLLELDANYRDARERLDKLLQMGDKE